MNSVSRVSAISGGHEATAPPPVPQKATDFQTIQSALKSGDLWVAQQVLVNLRQNPAMTAPATDSGWTMESSAAFQALQTALNSGNVSAAQQALATLQFEWGM
jgi:hypothetical protein